LLTTNVPSIKVLMIVQVLVPPLLIGTLAQPAWLALYPSGTPSVATQVAPVLNPVIVKDAGLPSFAGAVAGETFPLEQFTEIVTFGPPFGE
jgi:hypothetical protein